MLTVFDPPLPAELWNLLGPFHLPPHPAGPPWEELVRMYDGRIGTIVSPEDWSLLPRQVWCRCVALVSPGGRIVRWCRDDVDADRGRLWYHQDLVRSGDVFMRGRSGWVRVDADGKLSLAA